MPEVECTSKDCLNNRKGICTATLITFNKRCNDYISANVSSKSNNGICVRKNGALRNKSTGNTLK